MPHAERMAEIKQREQAATAGPWFWRGGKEAFGVKLIGASSWIVMDFVRYGMSSAQPRFLVNELLEKAMDLLSPREGQAHNYKWNSDIHHPDAQFLAHARTDIPYLVARVEELEAALGKAIDRLEQRAAIRDDLNLLDRLTVARDGEKEAGR